MFKLTLATPERCLFNGEEVTEVTVPGHKGELNVLAGHAPLMTTLVPGILQVVKANGSVEKMAICWGYCQVSPQGVNILADTALRAEEIDMDEVKSSKEEAEKALQSADLDEQGFETYFKRLKREEVRYAFAEMEQKGGSTH